MLRIIAGAAALASLVALPACKAQREAEATINNTEVEISTNLPENAVSDDQLNAVAVGAAAAASTPGGSATGVVVAPPSGDTTAP